MKRFWVVLIGVFFVLSALSQPALSQEEGFNHSFLADWFPSLKSERQRSYESCQDIYASSFEFQACYGGAKDSERIRDEEKKSGAEVLELARDECRKRYLQPVPDPSDSQKYKYGKENVLTSEKQITSSGNPDAYRCVQARGQSGPIGPFNTAQLLDPKLSEAQRKGLEQATKEYFRVVNRLSRCSTACQMGACFYLEKLEILPKDFQCRSDYLKAYTSSSKSNK